MDDASCPVSPTSIMACPIEAVGGKLRDAHAEDGRLVMVYGRPIEAGTIELRYLVNHPSAHRFSVFAAQAMGEAPSLAEEFPLLGWYEREIADLYGLRFAGHPEPYPLLRQTGERDDALTLDGEDVQHLPFGPIRADVVESAEFTFYYAGEAILHYQPRLFFKHRGMERRFEGLTPVAGAVLAERISGIGSFAHGLAFAQACEAAAQVQVPGRALGLRSLLAELERLYNHLAYLGHLADTTTLKVGQAEGKLLAERAKQINGRLTGSRFLRGIVTPGGLRQDVEPKAWFELALNALRADVERYVHRLLETNSFRDRLLTTGKLDRQTAFDQGATGPIARASGLDHDLRRDHPYAGYPKLTIPVPVREEGDADARFQLRIAELFASFDLVTAIYRDIEPGPIAVPYALPPNTEGLGWAESPRGSLFYAVHVGADGRFARVKVKSPSFSNWRVFPFTVEDSNMMDYAINEASFGLSTAGCDR